MKKRLTEPQKAKAALERALALIGGRNIIEMAYHLQVSDETIRNWRRRGRLNEARTIHAYRLSALSKVPLAEMLVLDEEPDPPEN